MKRAVENDLVNWHAAKDYTFLERTQENKLDGNGHVQSKKMKTQRDHGALRRTLRAPDGT